MPKENKLASSVKATMDAFEAKVNKLDTPPAETDKLAALRAHLDKQVEIPLDYIRIEDNVRRTIDTNSTKFSELVESIKRQGLLQNLVVELRVEEGIHQLFCIAGQRRLLAAKEAGKAKANCLIKEFDDPADRIASGLAENLTREDLYCLDIAEGFAGLIANGWSEDQVAEQFERNPRTIRRYLTIATWPQEAMALIRQHQDVFTTKLIFNELIAHRYETTEEFIGVIQSKLSAAGKAQPVQRTVKPKLVKDVEKALKTQLRMKVLVKGTEETGKLTIAYANADELARLQALLMSSETAN